MSFLCSYGILEDDVVLCYESGAEKRCSMLFGKGIREEQNCTDRLAKAGRNVQIPGVVKTGTDFF